MKLTTVLVALSLTAIGFCQATQPIQRVPRPHVRRQAQTANPQALATIQSSLAAAIQSMTSALPIYDGYRVKSIHAAHKALMIVDRMISGANVQVRPKPTVHDHVKSTKAHSRYSQQQIASSQAAMQQGLADLQQALSGPAITGKQASKAAALVQTAITDATTAIQIHSGH